MLPRALLSLAACALFAPSTHAARVDLLLHNSPNSMDPVSPRSRLFPFLAWLRDGAVEFVFGAPPAKTAARPTSHIQAAFQNKYKDQVVLRFNLTTVEEETVFAEAAARLFLDVWAFNHEYVDVRLRNDDVASLLGLLPQSLSASYSTLITDLAASVYDTYPSAAAATRTENLEDRRAFLQYSRREGDNVFFQEYQPLSVGFVACIPA